MALPTELLDHIASFVPHRHLPALASASARLCHVAQRRLFRHIALDARTLRAVLVLARCPHLARHVRSFALRIPPDAQLLRAFYLKLQRALSNMSALTDLDLSLDHAASWVLCTPHAPVFPRLARFASAFRLDAHVAEFLNKTPALRELEIDAATPDALRVLRPDALPLLAQFTGASDAAQLLVPTRPVEHIHLISGDFTEELATTLARSAAPILVLAAATSSHSVSLIGTLTRCMDRLVHLRIVTTYNFEDAPDTSYFANVADALTSLPDLQSCEIWGVHWISSQKSLHDERKVWESESFNTAPIAPNNLLTTGAFLEDLYSDFSFAY
ncbi:hypothetical protein BDN70DRAFT_927630 [Pholiota conissans]|uniref:F-box domain-containing protein n=1 Tax=Pholiota conissans TaxID=109636 RepID=A0A9P5ZEV1_9AGAR|nr:hypothetical protein BDN70DRAFT_927630 [Pholiota conissans]